MGVQRLEALVFDHGYRSAEFGGYAGPLLPHASAMAASAAGSDQVQSPSKEIAAAAATQPTRKPKRRRRDFFNRSALADVHGRFGDNLSISDRTVLVRLPVSCKSTARGSPRINCTFADCLPSGWIYVHRHEIQNHGILTRNFIK